MMTIARDLRQLAKVRHALTELTIEHGFTPDDAGLVVMAVDEACANAIRHGDGTAPIEIEAWCEGEAVTIEVRDDGGPYPFDELGNDGEAIDRDDVGGMGVYILKTFMDEARYHYAPESGSRLTLCKRRPIGDPDGE